jgi:leucyl-tRNA synthetase
MVLAPEHPLVSKVTSHEQKSNIEDYVQQAVRQTDIQRESAEKEKTGIFTGGYAINPVNNARIPIWIADYVLMTYGTGAIMAVPAHDERDFEFALKYGLPILPVIDRPDGVTKSFVPDKSVKKGFGSVLHNASIPFEEQTGGFYVSIPKEKIAEYVNIAQEYVRQDAWIDIIGAEWVFVFPGEVVGWDSVESDAVILDRCKALEVRVREYRTLMEMLWSCEYYRDTLNHHEYGVMINSGEFSGTPGETAVQKVTEWLAEQNKGKFEINYRLRDWLISRQRYWGTPIPIVYCDDCGVVTVPDEHLPVLLPDDVEWLPTGESPLKLHPTWKYVECPVCGEPAERETDTMDTFMCSSWYHLRYLSPRYYQGPFDADEYDYWMPVDTYTGGIEHATMHLIYTRFFHKAGRDMGVMKGPEPMVQLRNQGIILGEDSEKMSKSRGNVISPDNLVAQYGTDVVRAYLMFFARWDMGAPWNSKGIGGTARWVRRLWALITGDFPGPARAAKADPNVLKGLRRKVHQTLRQVTHDFNSFEFNTVISGLMELLNDMYRAMDGGAVGTQEWDEAVDIYLRMAAPVIPHVTEELWEKLGKPYSLHNQPWPVVDEAAAAEEQMILVVQVNGKIRDRLLLPVDTTEEQAKEAALNSDAVKIYIDGKALRKVIYVPGRLVNIVV